MSYRQIWIDNFGPIPVDEDGRSFEIHHINGDRSDNRPENLLCVSIDEHYLIHQMQCDHLACAAIAQRMQIDPHDQRELNRLGGLQARDQKLGIHSLSAEEKLANSIRGGESHRGYKWYTNGVEETQVASSPGPGWVLGRSCTTSGVKLGTILGAFWNNGVINIRSETCPGDGWIAGKLLTEEQRVRRVEIASGHIHTNEHKSKISAALKGRPKPLVTCPHCNKVGGASAMNRWHFDKCKDLNNCAS